MERFDHWIPFRVDWQHSQPTVDWCRPGPLRFTDPFFDQTIHRVLAHPANLLFQRQTPIEALGQWAALQPGLAPTGFIFHLSRCGSTLLSQMLAAVPKNLVIAEARPIDAVLRAPFRDSGITEDQRIHWLQWMVSALGQVRDAEQKHFFIKFDSWHVLFLPLIRRAFPAVPWVFIYRQPVEVLMSHWRQRGPQVIPGVLLAPALFGWDQSEVSAMSPEQYAARALGKFCEAVLEMVRGGTGKLLNYTQLPEIVLRDLIKFWGVEFAPADREQMLVASRLDAKNPFLPFEDDTALKNRNVPEKLRAAVQEWLEAPYQQLEHLRLARGFC